MAQIAPLVGARIETLSTCTHRRSLSSPLSWGRGLKPELQADRRRAVASPLSWGRGLKPHEFEIGRDPQKSPLSWGAD